VLALGLFAIGEAVFDDRGAAGVAGRLVLAALFVPLALSADRAVRRAAPRP